MSQLPPWNRVKTFSTLCVSRMARCWTGGPSDLSQQACNLFVELYYTLLRAQIYTVFLHFSLELFFDKKTLLDTGRELRFPVTQCSIWLVVFNSLYCISILYLYLMLKTWIVTFAKDQNRKPAVSLYCCCKATTHSYLRKQEQPSKFRIKSCPTTSRQVCFPFCPVQTTWPLVTSKFQAMVMAWSRSSARCLTETAF